MENAEGSTGWNALVRLFAYLHQNAFPSFDAMLRDSEWMHLDSSLFVQLPKYSFDRCSAQ